MEVSNAVDISLGRELRRATRNVVSTYNNELPSEVPRSHRCSQVAESVKMKPSALLFHTREAAINSLSKQLEHTPVI